MRMPVMLCLMSMFATTARADFEVEFSGAVQSDIRARVADVAALNWYNRVDFPAGISRNFNLVKLRALGRVQQVHAVADVDLLWLGVNTRVEDFSGLFERQTVEPLRIKAHAAYAEIDDLFVAGLDLRLGQQTIAWGTGDFVNPTNTLNPPDFEDPLLFGNQVANSMIRIEYGPGSDWSLSAVVVPVFVPAVYAPTSLLAVSDPSRLPFQQVALRWQLLAENAYTTRSLKQPGINTGADLQMPNIAFDNMQYALRLSGTVFGQDIALSYYYGRFTQPILSRIDVSQTIGLQCDQQQSSDCINGSFNNRLTLGFPRFQMLGINLGGEIPAVGIAWHAEIGVFFPARAQARIFDGAFKLNGVQTPAGEVNYGPGGSAPSIYQDTAFAKWNIGINTVLPEQVYVSAQWVHGFVDEFGAGDASRDGTSSGNTLTCLDPANQQQCISENLRPRLGDYLMIETQKSFFADRLGVDLWLLWDLTGVQQGLWDSATGSRVTRNRGPFSPDFASTIVVPSVTYAVGGGLVASAGLLSHLGTQQSKFGDPAQGAGTEVWMRVRYTF